LCAEHARQLVRESNFAEADKAFIEIAETGHAKGQELQAAQALRHLAEYQQDDAIFLKRLNAAEEALQHRSVISASDRNEELSRILRNRVVRASHMGNELLRDQSLKQLETMAAASRNRVIQSSYHGAAGSVLMDQKKYEDAMVHLEEDQDNPFTMELLARAYYQTNQPDRLHEAEAKLRATNVPTMEQALVVPAARSRRPAI
jgi:hypothetical protein